MKIGSLDIKTESELISLLNSIIKYLYKRKYFSLGWNASYDLNCYLYSYKKVDDSYICIIKYFDEKYSPIDNLEISYEITILPYIISEYLIETRNDKVNDILN